MLITGFGPFPGVPVNATMQLVPELAAAGTRAFAGVRIATAILATEWAAAPRTLDGLLAEVKPDLVLHFGVSSRARGFEVESRAANACTQMPDAAGILPAGERLRADGAEHVKASLPVQHIVARLRAAGHPGVRVEGCRRLSVQRHALSFAGLRARCAGPARRLHPYSRDARPAGRCQPRARRRLPAHLGAGRAGGLEILAACLGLNVGWVRP